METGKSFKIRKTGFNKTRNLQDIQDQELVANLDDLRISQQNFNEQANIIEQQKRVLQPQSYEDDEENINCYRFPHSTFCGCPQNCLLQSFQPIQAVAGLYFGNFVTGLKSKHLLDLGITHILNVTCKQYTKKNHYFTYSTIDLRNTTEEDAKKFFRISNRFIKDTLENGGKVFVHCSVMEIGAMMVSAFMIGNLKISLKQCLLRLNSIGIEMSPHFLKQLQSYDLQKMAFISIQRQ